VTAKRAVVLGASTGLGAHVARRLAAEGWTVTGTARRPRSATDLPDEVRYLSSDLADDEDLRSLGVHLQQIDPDLVVHSAVTYGDRTATRRSVADLEAMFRVNAVAPFVALRDHLAGLPAERACSCVIVNSDAMYHANDTSAEYAATKAALLVMTAGLAATCRGRRSSVSTLVLGPLADPAKLAEIEAIAERKGIPAEEVVRLFLARSNPSLMITELIDLEACVRSVLHIASLGSTANGMVVKLDGGSSGSLG